MKARDRVRLDALRSALAGFTYKRTESGQELTDADELDVVRRLVKQRTDAMAEYEKAARSELADKERAERELLSSYLPRQKTPEEIRAIVKETVAALTPEARNQGNVMKGVMARLRGLADGNLVRQIVTEELANP